MQTTQIIGILLVKNDDIYVKQVLRNVIDFCDKFYIFDNYSEDETFECLQEFAGKYQKIELSRIEDPVDSHKCLEKYANTRTWVFAVDGDEIYDPQRLLAFRKELIAGDYDRYFHIKGNVLNCTCIDRLVNKATGYLSPPSRSICKLYNFNSIYSWTNCPSERLHDGDVVYKNGYSFDKKYHYYEDFSWDESKFRCLHACFVARSSLDEKKKEECVMKINIRDQVIEKEKGLYQRCKDAVNRILGRRVYLNWKLMSYNRGELVSKPIDCFFCK